MHRAPMARLLHDRKLILSVNAPSCLFLARDMRREAGRILRGGEGEPAMVATTHLGANFLGVME